MDTHTTDAIVIGAGIAGATAAAQIAADRRVALIEAEDQPGYHTTGRSAAMWILNYGPADVRVLTGLSRPFFEAPPEGFTETTLMARRPLCFLAPPEQMPGLRTLLAEGIGVREISVNAARAMVPALRPDYAVGAAIEDDAFDIDVAALHQGFLRLLRRRGGILALRSRTGRIGRRAGLWDVEVTGGAVFRAPVLVNAAGAWGDEVAAQAGVAPLGLQPKRRTGVIIDPAPWDVSAWPLVYDVAHTWYVRTEARTRLMVTPCDETDMPAARRAAGRTRRGDRHRPHAAGAGYRGAPGRAVLGGPAHLHARPQPGDRLGPARRRDSCGASGRAATVSRPRRRRGGWWRTWWPVVIPDRRHRCFPW